jgi:hypothetical protein
MKKSNSTEKIEKYLKNLTKEELVTLILKFAPKTFLDALHIQFVDEDEAKVIFANIRQEINNLFVDEELLYNPSEFEHQLSTRLELLRCLWDKLSTETENLILEIITNTEKAFEDGYLYTENYGRKDDYFESEDINNYIVSFVNNLPENKKLIYIKKLRDVLENFGYSTFLGIEKKLFNS